MNRMLPLLAACITGYQYAGICIAPNITDTFLEKAAEIFHAEAERYAIGVHLLPGKKDTLKKVITLSLIAQIMEKCGTQEIKKSQNAADETSSPLTSHWRGSIPTELYDVEMMPDLVNIFKYRAQSLVTKKSVLFLCTHYTRIVFETLSSKKQKSLSQKIAALIQTENVMRANQL